MQVICNIQWAMFDAYMLMQWVWRHCMQQVYGNNVQCTITAMMWCDAMWWTRIRITVHILIYKRPIFNVLIVFNLIIVLHVLIYNTINTLCQCQCHGYGYGVVCWVSCVVCWRIKYTFDKYMQTMYNSNMWWYGMVLYHVQYSLIQYNTIQYKYTWTIVYGTTSTNN